MKISWTRAYLLFEDALRLIVRATGHLQVALAVFIGLALKSWCPWPSIFFLYVIWLFPERVLGVIALSFYLLLWLPSSYHLPFHIHMVLLAAYMLATPPRWRRFRTWSGWNSIRNRFYPIKYDTFAPPRSTHPDRREAPRIYAIAPHGVYGEGVHLTMVLTEKFADVVPVGSSVMTWLPIVKDVCALCGMIPATKSAIMETLSAENDILLVPEGIRGILYEKAPHLVGQRKGFVECAVQAGADIIPVYMHNVWTLYDKWPVLSAFELTAPPSSEDRTSLSSYTEYAFHRLQHWMLSSCLKYPPLICWGALGGFFPHPTEKDSPIRVSFGQPIPCQKMSPADPRFDSYVSQICDQYYGMQSLLSDAYARGVYK